MRVASAIGLLLVIALAGCTSSPSGVGGGDAAPLVSPTAPPSNASTPPPAPPPPPAAQSSQAKRGNLAVAYVNVGQGDGAVWRLPNGAVVVYDCGPPHTTGTNPVNAYLQTMGLPTGARIAALVASHGHQDHIGGCSDVLGSYRLDHVYEAWYERADAPLSYQRFRDQVSSEGAVVHTLSDASLLANEQVFHQGDALALPLNATAAGVDARLIWPPSWQGASWDDIARSSLGVRLSYGNVSFCFQGDIEEAQEAALASSSGDLSCTVYLMGHHGSKHASSAAWLAKMKPRVAVVSFGDNTYGHPTQEALCRVQQAGARVYATHRLGTVLVSTDGTNVTVEPAQPETTDYCAPGASYWDAPRP